MLEANPTQSHALGSEDTWGIHKIQIPQPHSIAQVNARRLFKQYFWWQYGEINIDFNYILEVLHGLVHKEKVEEECNITCASVTNGVWHDEQELVLNSPALCTLTDFHDCSLEHEIKV